MKKGIMMIIFLLCLLPLAGCHNIEKNNVAFDDETIRDSQKPILKLEILNITNDASLFLEIKLDYIKKIEAINSSEMNQNEKDELIKLANIQYLDDLNKFALSRVVSDIETIYVNSKEYMDYIAMLQTYVDSYELEKNILKENFPESKTELNNMKTAKSYILVNKFYMDIINSAEDK